MAASRDSRRDAAWHMSSVCDEKAVLACSGGSKVSCIGMLAHALVSKRDPEATHGHPYVVCPRPGIRFFDCARLQLDDRPAGPLFELRAGRATPGRLGSGALTAVRRSHLHCRLCRAGICGVGVARPSRIDL